MPWNIYNLELFGERETATAFFLQTILLHCDGAQILNLKCTECGNPLKNSSNEEQTLICPICETQYKIVSNANGKQRLEAFTFGGNDPGEL